MDAIVGCPELQLPKEHLARQVKAFVAELDFSRVEEKYSSLGQRGFSPQSLLAVWVYGSLIGIHSSTQLGAQLKTDAAIRFLAGGHVISSATLRRFRNQNADFFAHAIQQTITIATERGLLKLDEGAVDSVRLHAHASRSAIRTVKRSKARLAELEAADISSLSAEEIEHHKRKLNKHRDALTQCEQRGRTNIITTNPSAGLLKFPDGASAPGHRVTVTAFGVSERIVASVLIDADGADQGKLQEAIDQMESDLQAAGVDTKGSVQVAADAGYSASTDLTYAMKRRGEVDLLVALPKYTRYNPKKGHGVFSQDHFDFTTKSATCPAGKAMDGPESDGPESIRFHGVGCSECPLKPKCTKSKKKTLVIRPHIVEARRAMQERMSEPGAVQRYNKRIATVEPVFSIIEHVMKYRRVGTRHTEGARAEILLKILAYNISRLNTARKLACYYVLKIEF